MYYFVLLLIVDFMMRKNLLFYFIAVSMFLIQTVYASDFNSNRKRQRIEVSDTENYAAYDLIYQRMEWSVDPGIRYIKGKITSYVKSLSDGLDVIEFDLDTALVVDSVKFHRGLITHLHADNKIYLNLPGQLSKGEIDTVVVYYQGEPAS